METVSKNTTANHCNLSSRHSSKSLKSNVTWTLIGNIFFVASQMVLLSLLAHLGSEDEVGKYALAVSIVTPILLIFNLHLNVVQATDQEHRFCLADYMGLRLITSSLALLVIVGWSFCLSSPELIAITISLGVSRLIDSFSLIYCGEFQRHEQMKYVSISMILRGFGTAGAFTITYLWTRDVLLATMSMSIPSLICLMVFDATNYNRHLGSSRIDAFRVQFHCSQLKSLLYLALPAGFVNSANGWIVNIPRILLYANYGTAALGLYAAVGYFMSASGIVLAAVNQTTLSRLSKHAHNDAMGYWKLLIKVAVLNTLFAVMSLVMAYWLGDFALKLLFGYQDPSLRTALMIAMTGMACRFIARSATTGLRATQKVWTLAFGNVLVLSITVTVGMLIIPRHGMIGAAWTVLITAISELAILATLMWLTTRINSRTTLIRPEVYTPYNSPAELDRRNYHAA